MRAFLIALVLLPLAAGHCATDNPYISWAADSGIFPDSWVSKPFYATAEPIDPVEEARAEKLVSEALEKYPPALVQKTLRRVYLLGDLVLYKNQKFSGTASHEHVYLVVKSTAAGFTDYWVESTFHAEYSTLLLNRHLKLLDQEAWRKVNPPGFRYGGGNSWDRLRGKDGGARAIDAGATSLKLETREEFLRHGFLTEYSRSSLENDFNVYASVLFTNHPKFWEVVEKHPGVARKCGLAIRFYSTLDPTLNRAYFKSLKSRP